ncbi:hypothetical protein OF83DRAFT_1048291 [Amylostereum chailletii]|nr:hypothetical protein OF83DRAFT_1048291 [Amylostereum chailletii]
MPDWNSPVEQAHDADAFAKLIHAMLGLYIWEFVTSLDFDWAIISERKFRWPMVFYFLGRYILLGALVGVAISLDVTEVVDCQALYTFNQCAGNFAIGMGVWRLKWYIVVPLVAIILGHWSLLLHGILLKAQWVEGEGCVITQTNSTILSASFIYSMGFDLLVLVLTAYKLAKPEGGKSRLVQLIFNDGLVYFVVAFLANMIATIFMLLNLDPIMSIVANVPAAVASTIVASRVVRRLSNLHTASAEVFES